MSKITFIGAGSTVFARNVLGDAMLTEALRDADIALYDIDPMRLRESRRVIDAMNAGINRNRARIRSYCGVARRQAALKGADFVINAIQVGGYEPATVADFEIPARYGLRQTIGDTLGIGGIFRGLRTIPILLDIARDMEAVCPNAWLLNYSNPMAILTGALLRATPVKCVGLCHSVQVLVQDALMAVGLRHLLPHLPAITWRAAGINHMCWLLKASHRGRDLYPLIRRRAEKTLEDFRTGRRKEQHQDLVRLEVVRNFGYFVSESSVHNAEYAPYWIKSAHPELLERLQIPLDEYPRRCRANLAGWKDLSRTLMTRARLRHTRTHEYAADIMNALVTGQPFQFHGNVLNESHILNLPPHSVVEVPCVADERGVRGCPVEPLPEQCAGLNRTNINVHLMTIEAALSHRREAVYQAALLDPHTAAELTTDQIRHMCDDMIAAHSQWLPASMVRNARAFLGAGSSRKS